MRDRCLLQLALLHTINVNVIWAVYWLVAHQMRRPEGFTDLIAEIDASKNAWILSHPEAGPVLEDEDAFFDWLWNAGSSMPLLTSTIQETLRWSTSTASIRLVMRDTSLGGYTLQAGQRLLCFPRMVHLDDEIHENASAFNPTRFMDTDKMRTKDGKRISNYSMPFGGGVSMCEGR
jgi:cytochrome P450